MCLIVLILCRVKQQIRLLPSTVWYVRFHYFSEQIKLMTTHL